MKIPATLLIALMVTGCAHTSVYDSVAEELNTVRVQRVIGYYVNWAPEGSHPTELTAEQQAALHAAIAGCVEKLKASAPWEPGEIVATVQLVSCMHEKNWSVTVEEIVVAG
ncbi:MAG TPA: hypothetical protein VJS12_23125 [Steroidobacteraceae bacterium]|nr:hypothetical protein [Steroidobacteraceae bacterium]